MQRRSETNGYKYKWSFLYALVNEAINGVFFEDEEYEEVYGFLNRSSSSALSLLRKLMRTSIDIHDLRFLIDNMEDKSRRNSCD